MKKIILFAGVLLLGIACSKIKPSKVEANITNGSWRVLEFSEDGENETFHFSSYNFTFSEDGNVTASNGSTSIYGSWTLSDGDDDSKETHFNLVFPASEPFDELTDDWHVISSSDSKLELEDVSGGDGSIDKLTFGKN